MRTRHIEVFHAVLQAGTLTGAAKLLNISQPAATKLLQQAERQLGFPLFTRLRGRLQVTPAAAVLRSKIEQISDDMHELRRLASNLRHSEPYTLRVVSTPALANAVIPKAVTRVRKSVREATIELSTQHSREMLKSILLRETDIGLTLQELQHPGVCCESLSHGALMVIAPSGWWAKEDVGRPISIEQLAASPIVGIEVRDTLGRQLQAHLEYLSPPPKISTWVQTYQLARSLVANGHGLALVDPFTAHGDGDDSVQIRPLAPQIPVSLFAIYRLETGLQPMQKIFLEHVRVIANLVFTMLSVPAPGEV